MEDNSYAGQGSVLLDIGGDVGALVVTMPRELEGVEIEIRPVGAAHGHSHLGADHVHDHDHGHSHSHPSPWPHVAVVARPAGADVVYSAVYPELTEGAYELYERPHGPVRLSVEVTGGEVQYAAWPL